MPKLILSLFLCTVIFSNNLFAQATNEKPKLFQLNYIFERSLSMQIGTFNTLNEALERQDLKIDATSLYFNFGVGYTADYKQFSISSIGRYGINLFKLNQHTLDWNILQLSYHFNVNPTVQLTPKIGYGIMHVPMHIKLENNFANNINDLSNNANTMTVVNDWDYVNVGLAITPRRNKSIALGINYAIGLSKSNWRNDEIILNDVAAASMNTISLNFSYLL